MMIAAMLIFDLGPSEPAKAAYLDYAATLRKELEPVAGFVSLERFESMNTPGRILALSIWKDEQSLSVWRNLDAHRKAQAAGRSGLFLNYRIRVCEVLREYGPADREQAPADSRAVHG
jgi:heme-degrading monooxygenase HmoA